MKQVKEFNGKVRNVKMKPKDPNTTKKPRRYICNRRSSQLLVPNNRKKIAIKTTCLCPIEGCEKSFIGKGFLKKHFLAKHAEDDCPTYMCIITSVATGEANRNVYLTTQDITSIFIILWFFRCRDCKKKIRFMEGRRKRNIQAKIQT